MGRVCGVQICRIYLVSGLKFNRAVGRQGLKRMHMNRLMNLLVLVLLGGCSDPNSLKPEEFQQCIKATSDAIVIDVRTSEETTEHGIIAGARVLDYNRGDFKTKMETLDKSKSYFVYCASGKRSGQAAQLMRDNGFEKVFILEGGTKAWAEEGFELVK
jgi:rhodanese-related sulfurtransferase